MNARAWMALALLAAGPIAQADDTPPGMSTAGTPLVAAPTPSASTRAATRLPAGYGVSVIDGSRIALPRETASQPPGGMTTAGTPMPAAAQEPAASTAGLNVAGQPLVTPAPSRVLRVSPSATTVHP